jgi:hypothetical protein
LSGPLVARASIAAGKPSHLRTIHFDVVLGHALEFFELRAGQEGGFGFHLRRGSDEVAEMQFVFPAASVWSIRIGGRCNGSRAHLAP